MTPATSPTARLVDVTRGAQVESGHRGAIALATPDGTITALGDVGRLVFPRSAIKALQLLPFVATGGADRQHFAREDLAFACASHHGEPIHADRAAATLKHLGLDESALACGAHWPGGYQASRDMIRSGSVPGRRHNNCSGKHVAMIAAAIDFGADIDGYARPDHPVQRRICEALGKLSGADLTDRHPGVDGCGAPNWPMTVSEMAVAFARFASGSGLDNEDAAAAKRILQACWDHPELVGGTERLDTAALRIGRDIVFLKTGAEGVYCGAFVEAGIGFALKIEDGATRASEFVVLSLLASVYSDFYLLLEPRRILKN